LHVLFRKNCRANGKAFTDYSRHFLMTILFYMANVPSIWVSNEMKSRYTITGYLSKTCGEELVPLALFRGRVKTKSPSLVCKSTAVIHIFPKA